MGRVIVFVGVCESSVIEKNTLGADKEVPPSTVGEIVVG